MKQYENHPSIDEKQWNELVDLLEEDFNELVEQFMADCHERLLLIKQAQQTADNASGLEAAHAMKGASANLGATLLSQQCFKMQEICHAGMIADAHNVVADIETELHTLVDEIKRRLA